MDTAPKSVAGHPPAVKVGGMRVARRRTSSGPGSESSKQTKPKESNEPTTNGAVHNGDSHESASDATSTPASESADAVKEKDKTAEQIEKEERALRKRQQHEANLLIAGAMTRGDQDFPTAAVRAFHEKPEPTRDPPRHQPPPSFHQQKHAIQQPPAPSFHRQSVPKVTNKQQVK